ncbi:hypothetical protein P0Y67_14220 [Photobacterium sp. SP02]|uniref:hypothetical protein n=1 Tax=Photobacterium sp. SP02 TaxID=3032280 RepID=UPI0031451238
MTATNLQSGIYVEKSRQPLTTIRCAQISIGMLPDDRETEAMLAQYRNLLPSQFDFDTWVNKDQDLDDAIGE